MLGISYDALLPELNQAVHQFHQPLRRILLATGYLSESHDRRPTTGLAPGHRKSRPREVTTRTGELPSHRHPRGNQFLPKEPAGPRHSRMHEGQLESCCSCVRGPAWCRLSHSTCGKVAAVTVRNLDHHTVDLAFLVLSVPSVPLWIIVDGNGDGSLDRQPRRSAARRHQARVRRRSLISNSRCIGSVGLGSNLASRR